MIITTLKSFYFHLGNSDANDLVDINESDNLSQHYEDAFSSPTSNKQINSEVSTGKQVKCSRSLQIYTVCFMVHVTSLLWFSLCGYRTEIA